jgi:hypothetical protein
LTSSADNVGWASTVDIDKRESGEELFKIFSRGKGRGNFVWILKGSEAFSSDTVRVCRSFPDFAFIFVYDEYAALNSPPDLKNALILIKNGDKKRESEVLRAKIPYILLGEHDPLFDHSGEKGRVKGPSSPSVSSFSLRHLMKFLESPSHPIAIECFSEVLDMLEDLLSSGKSLHIPRYFA